ncbi:hypothetical protein R3P38DRAFT_983428 [Favolaschia claudopus]|uniref:Uncharacterized protein n=1 Tax=Favolaschia claudopus TaxID=2862362 RepID=A0AAW0BIC2_9AGAR
MIRPSPGMPSPYILRIPLWLDRRIAHVNLSSNSDGQPNPIRLIQGPPHSCVPCMRLTFRMLTTGVLTYLSPHRVYMLRTTCLPSVSESSQYHTFKILPDLHPFIPLFFYDDFTYSPYPTYPSRTTIYPPTSALPVVKFLPMLSLSPTHHSLPLLAPLTNLIPHTYLLAILPFFCHVYPLRPSFPSRPRFTALRTLSCLVSRHPPSSASPPRQPDLRSLPPSPFRQSLRLKASPSPCVSALYTIVDASDSIHPGLCGAETTHSSCVSCLREGGDSRMIAEPPRGRGC